MIQNLKQYLLQCKMCNGTREILMPGMMKKACETCKWKINLEYFYIPLLIRWIKNPLKETPVAISIIIAILFIKISFSYPNYFTAIAVVAAIGLIYTALKYKLDQANYNKDLFEKRYEIYLIIEEVLSDWGNNLRGTMEMTKKLNGIMRKSYYLFSNDTYKFICNFKEAIIITTTDIQKSDERYKEIIEKAKEFLVPLLDNENLPAKFPELKLDIY